MSRRAASLLGIAVALAGVTTYGVVLTTGVLWPAILGTLAIMAGLLIMGSVMAPTRATFKGGVRIWQNDGLP